MSRVRFLHSGGIRGSGFQFVCVSSLAIIHIFRLCLPLTWFSLYLSHLIKHFPPNTSTLTKIEPRLLYLSQKPVRRDQVRWCQAVGILALRIRTGRNKMPNGAYTFCFRWKSIGQCVGLDVALLHKIDNNPVLNWVDYGLILTPFLAKYYRS